MVHRCHLAVCAEKEKTVRALKFGRDGTAGRDGEGEEPRRGNLELLSVIGLPPKGSTCTLEVGTTDALPTVLPTFSFKLLLRTLSASAIL